MSERVHVATLQVPLSLRELFPRFQKRLTFGLLILFPQFRYASDHGHFKKNFIAGCRLCRAPFHMRRVRRPILSPLLADWRERQRMAECLLLSRRR